MSQALRQYPLPEMFCWVCENKVHTRVLFDKHYLTGAMIYFCSPEHKLLHAGLKNL